MRKTGWAAGLGCDKNTLLLPQLINGVTGERLKRTKQIQTYVLSTEKAQ